MKLYELSSTYKHLQEALDTEDAPNKIWEGILSEIKDSFGEKAINIAKMLQSLEAEKKAYEEEAKRLSARAKTKENGIQSLKQYLQHNMELTNLNEIKGDVVKINLQNSPPSVEIIDETKIPRELMRATVVMPYNMIPEELFDYLQNVVPDKILILQIHKDTGEIMPGVAVVVKKHIRIR